MFDSPNVKKLFWHLFVVAKAFMQTAINIYKNIYAIPNFHWNRASSKMLKKQRIIRCL